MSAPRVPATTPDRSAILAWRRSQRADLIGQRMALPIDAHRCLSNAVLDHLLTVFPDLWGARIGLYWPRKREISLFPLANRIVAHAGLIALPVVVGHGQPLQFRAWRPGDPLAADTCDIPCPRDGHVVQPEVLLVALVGFDAANYRLGYGGGFYDRTLAAAEPRPTTIGVGFELMRLKTIKPMAHDIPMDAIVTEAGVFRRSLLRS
jgi:5-formyltetrahydrofolate cyclo-ligase